MPIIQVNMVRGRPPEKIEGMIAAVSQAVADSLDAPIETVRVMVNEMDPHGYGIGGRPFTEIKAERAAAAAAEADGASQPPPA